LTGRVLAHDDNPRLAQKIRRPRPGPPDFYCRTG
jgi:hypothetical protein